MRILLLVPLLAISACAALDGTTAQSHGSIPSTKIFLSGNQRVNGIFRTQLNHYGCHAGLLVCDRLGGTYECECQMPMHPRILPEE